MMMITLLLHNSHICQWKDCVICCCISFVARLLTMFCCDQPNSWTDTESQSICASSHQIHVYTSTKLPCKVSLYAGGAASHLEWSTGGISTQRCHCSGSTFMLTLLKYLGLILYLAMRSTFSLCCPEAFIQPRRVTLSLSKFTPGASFYSTLGEYEN